VNLFGVGLYSIPRTIARLWVRKYHGFRASVRAGDLPPIGAFA
jgi:hypothetical protein